MPRTSQKTSHGSSKSLLQHLIHKNGSKTPEKEKALSSSSSSEDISSPYKNSLTKIKTENKDDTDDFKTPIKMFTKMFKQAPSKKGKSNAKRSSKIKNPMIKRTKDNFKNLDVDAEQLQMAIALSKSTFAQEYPEQALENTEPDLPTFLSPNNIPKCTTFLEKYGFKTKRSTLQADVNGEVIRFQETKRPKKSKYRFVTPVLFLRSDKERQDLIDNKVSRLLSEQKENTFKNTNIYSVELNSTFLGDYAEEKKCWQMNCFNDFDAYICPSLELSPTKAAAGYLLKDWENIPGRARSPIPDRVSKEISDDTMECQHSSMKSNEMFITQECSSINQEGSTRSPIPDTGSKEICDDDTTELQHLSMKSNETLIITQKCSSISQEGRTGSLIPDTASKEISDDDTTEFQHSCIKSNETLINQECSLINQEDKMCLDAQSNKESENEYAIDVIVDAEVAMSFKVCNIEQAVQKETHGCDKLDISVNKVDKCISPDLFDSDNDNEDYKSPSKSFSKDKNVTKENLLDSPTDLKDMARDKRSHIGVEESPIKSRYFETSPDNLKMSSLSKDMVQKIRCNLYNKGISCDPPKYSLDVKPLDLTVDTVVLENRSRLNSSERVNDRTQESQDKVYKNDICEEKHFNSCDNSSDKEITMYDIPDGTILENKENPIRDISKASNDSVSESSKQSQRKNLYKNKPYNGEPTKSSIQNISSTKEVFQKEVFDFEVKNSAKNDENVHALSCTESETESTKLSEQLPVYSNNSSLPYSSKDTCKSTTVVLSTNQSPKRSYQKVSCVDLSDDDLTQNVAISSKNNSKSDSFVTKRKKQFAKFYSSEMLDMDLSDSEIPNSVNLSAKSKSVSDDMLGISLHEKKNSSGLRKDAIIDLSQTDSNDSESGPLDAHKGNLSFYEIDLAKTTKEAIGDQDQDTANSGDEFGKPVEGNEEFVDLTQSSDDNTKDSGDVNDKVITEPNPQCRNKKKLEDSSRQSFGTKTYSRDSGNISCEFSSTKSLNVTDYVLGILNLEDDAATENNVKHSEDLPDAEYFSQSHSTCSQGSIEVLDDEELNYSMKFSAQNHKNFYNLTNFDDMCVGHGNEPKDIEAVHLDEPSPTSSKTHVVNDINTETPDKNSKLNYKSTTNTNTTPNGNVIIKTNNITPMANYDAMNSPQIRVELDKFGIKPLKRRRGIQLLKYIYDTTHPFVQDENVEEVSEEEQTREAKRRKLSDKFEKTESINIVGSSLIESEQESDLLFERKFRKTIMSCRVPLQLAWYNFLCCNPSLSQSIVLYEPIQLEVIHSMLKEQSGCNFHVEDLITFLDKKCITFRTNQWQASRKKAKEKS
ncbi:uncharacterized protein LOC114334157 isoform X2 [Diabrotica virgifera virgifera]|uniref:Structure-specific endonuclease subunit SLX4 n=1 Tax=Diabrotica virgifera virgifera TaxID=50390 RepID=A0A6P7G4U1_DIAVI|nr:uncharacterized protein LOC114334157 isoform X2 [Diabrotica virgifera virgifera]